MEREFDIFESTVYLKGEVERKEADPRHKLHHHNCFQSGCRVLQETCRLVIQIADISSNFRL